VFFFGAGTEAAPGRKWGSIQVSNLLKVSDDLQQQMLSDLCARNQPSELVCNTSAGKKIRAKVRFLHLSGQRLFIDLPIISGRTIMIRPGEVIQLYFLWKGQRFLATSIIQARVRLQEHKTKTLEALAIQYPYEIERAQRRECYRLSLTHLPSAKITFCWAEDLNKDSPPDQLCEKPTTTDDTQQEVSSEEISNELPATTPNVIAETPDPDINDQEGSPQLKPLQGRMINLSETGCLAVFDKKKAPPFKQGHLYHTTFLLPDFEEPFEMTAEIRWSQKHPAGDRVFAGIVWQLDPKNREQRDIQSTISKFITNEQREALRRAKQS